MHRPDHRGKIEKSPFRQAEIVWLARGFEHTNNIGIVFGGKPSFLTFFAQPYAYGEILANSFPASLHDLDQKL